jgi:hypothetical protein
LKVILQLMYEIPIPIPNLNQSINHPSGTPPNQLAKTP